MLCWTRGITLLHSAEIFHLVPAATVVCACIFVGTHDAHCLHSSSFTALLLQGQQVLRREAATLLQRSLAAEKLAADRLADLTAKEREAAHLQQCQCLCEANTALADALEVVSLPVPRVPTLSCAAVCKRPVRLLFVPQRATSQIVDITRTNSRHLLHMW